MANTGHCQTTAGDNLSGEWLVPANPSRDPFPRASARGHLLEKVSPSSWPKPPRPTRPGRMRTYGSAKRDRFDTSEQSEAPRRAFQKCWPTTLDSPHDCS